MLAASAAALLAMFGSASFAGGKCWSNCNGSAFASAGAGGFAGTAMGGKWKNTFSDQTALTLSLADTKPESALADAALHQETGGAASGPGGVGGELYMQGETNVYAQVGRRGVGADTNTEGTGTIYAEGTGDHTYMDVSLYGASNQSSYAVDTPWGDDDGAEAEQVTVGVASGVSYGSHSATTEVGVSVSSYAEAN